MTLDLLWALVAFAFVSSITPGPNNLMLMTSGANFGFSRTLPHMFGVGVGFIVMLMLVGLGLAQIFETYEQANTILKVLCVLYMLFLAWKIANAAPPGNGQAEGTPITFMQAALFQWVNPKAWMMGITAATVYAPGRTLESVTLMALVFGLINIPCVSLWTVMGQKMRSLLSERRHLRMFNITMAVLLIASLYPVLQL
jgi:threonine/homoserine/homoserine lactone efflux protein